MHSAMLAPLLALMAAPGWPAAAAAARALSLSAREAKLVRALPAVTDSLLNLGKMDIAFYINSNPQDARPAASRGGALPAARDQPCACARALARAPAPRARARTSAHTPAHLLAELFAQSEPDMSPLCCDSHEQVREDSILFEFGPKQSPMFGDNVPPGRLPAPLPTLLLDALGPANPAQLAGQQKIVELFLFPNKKEIALDLGKITKNHNVLKDIKIVGDKAMRNDFKAMTLAPPPPPPRSSVKKDLTVQRAADASEGASAAPDTPDTPGAPDAISNTSKANVV